MSVAVVGAAVDIGIVQAVVGGLAFRSALGLRSVLAGCRLQMVVGRGAFFVTVGD